MKLHKLTIAIALLATLTAGGARAAPAALPRAVFAIDPLRAIMTKIAQLQGKIVAELKTMDALASTPISGSTATPPDIWDPYAHACLPTLITFIQSTPTPASLPTPPAGSAIGPLVSFELTRLKLIGIDDFVTSINQRGFPASLKMACAAYISDIKGLPFQLSTDINANLVALFNVLVKGIAG